MISTHTPFSFQDNQGPCVNRAVLRMHRHTHTDTQTHTHIFSLTGPGAWLLLLSSLPSHQAPEGSSLPWGRPQRRSGGQQGPGQWKFAAHFLGEGRWQECILSTAASLLSPGDPAPGWVTLGLTPLQASPSHPPLDQ